MLTQFQNQLFNLGTIVMTSGAAARMHDLKIAPNDLLIKHAQGEWGNVCDEDAFVNNQNVKSKGMILSSYGNETERIWIITDAGHGVTTFLLPDEY